MADVAAARAGRLRHRHRRVALGARCPGPGLRVPGPRLEAVRADRPSVLPPHRGRPPAGRRQQGPAQARLEAAGQLRAAHHHDGPRRRRGRAQLAWLDGPLAHERPQPGHGRSCSARADCWVGRWPPACRTSGIELVAAPRGRGEGDITDARACGRAAGPAAPGSRFQRRRLHRRGRRGGQSGSRLRRQRRRSAGAGRRRQAGRAPVWFTTRPISCSTASERRLTTRTFLRRRLRSTPRASSRANAGCSRRWSRSFVLRVGCLYGRGGRNFPSTLLRRLQAGEADSRRQRATGLAHLGRGGGDAVAAGWPAASDSVCITPPPAARPPGPTSPGSSPTRPDSRRRESRGSRAPRFAFAPSVPAAPCW